MDNIIPSLLVVIPTHNHYKALPQIIKRLQESRLPILLVDDGSDEKTQDAIQHLTGIDVIRIPINQGKGKAFFEGLIWAETKGYSHVFQIDADGQQSLETVEAFIDLSRRNPQALISGQPIYDDSMPRSRRIGRWFTHVWVWIETLSFRITDSLCGYRIYPVESSLKAMRTHKIGYRMQFDTEIMVRLFWEGVPVIMSPVKVTYPQGNSSNFDVLWDNWRITKMHTKMVLTLLLRLPRILKNRPNYRLLDLPKESTHWASMKERAPLFGLFFLAFCYKCLGRKACSVLSFFVVFYYFLLKKEQRQASETFLRRAGISHPKPFRHFMSFFHMALDKFSAWIGRQRQEEVVFLGEETFETLMRSEKGGLLMVSHLGNMEFCRATAQGDYQKKLHILLHSKNSERYHHLLRAFNPLSTTNIIEVTEVGPDTLIYLKERISVGEWVVIAADRVPVSVDSTPSSRVQSLSFLGKEAFFSQGPYILASLLECPVYLSMAIRDEGKMKVSIEKLSDKIELRRRHREEDILPYMQQYVLYLEKFAQKFPYQWFNFFDFWQQRP